jgi:hypothetical protein
MELKHELTDAEFLFFNILETKVFHKCKVV